MWHTIRNGDGSYPPQSGLTGSQQQDDPLPAARVALRGITQDLDALG
jgi:hypothetical protein